MRRRELPHHTALSCDRLLTIVGDFLVSGAWDLFVLHVWTTVDPLLGLDQLGGDRAHPIPCPETENSRTVQFFRRIRAAARRDRGLRYSRELRRDRWPNVSFTTASPRILRHFRRASERGNEGGVHLHLGHLVEVHC